MSELTSLEKIIIDKITGMMEAGKKFGFTYILDSEIMSSVTRDYPDSDYIDSGTIGIALNNLVIKGKLKFIGRSIGREESNCVSYTLINQSTSTELIGNTNIKFLNLTPHKVVIENELESVEFASIGNAARVETENRNGGIFNVVPNPNMTEYPASVLVSEQVFGDIEGLPEPKDGTLCIVSSIVLQAAKSIGRTDCVAPDTANAKRNKDNQIISVPGFVK